MRFTLKGAHDKFKAQDINLQLNANTRNDTRSVLQLINNRLSRSELYENIDNGDVNYIPDDADVNRIDLRHVIEQPDDESYEDRRERRSKQDEKSTEIQVNARGMMKKANRDDIFVAFSPSNDLMAIINNYKVVYRSSGYDRSQNDNAARILRSSDFILHFKIDEVTANAEKSRNRKENTRNTPNIQRDKYKSSNKSKLNAEYKKFIELINDQSIEDTPTRPIKIKDLKEGDVYKEYRSGRSIWKALSIKKSTMDDDEFIIEAISVPNHKGDKTYERTRVEFHDETYYILDTDVIQEVPDINWKQLLYKRQAFPKALFPRDNIYDIERSWSNMLSYIKHDEKTDKSAHRVQKTKIEEKDYNGYRSSMSYRDKSGYMVDLTKYFDKMKELVKGTPQVVKTAYENAFKIIETKQKEIIVSMKQLAQDEEWDKLKRHIDFLDYYGTKKFNKNTEKTLKDENYTEEHAWDKMSQGRALNVISTELDTFNRAATSIQAQNQD